MSWLSDFFRKDKVRVLESTAKTIGKLFLGAVADNAWTATQNAVAKAEGMGGSGDEKFEYAMKDIVTTLRSPSTKRWILSLLIELAVGVMRARMGLE